MYEFTIWKLVPDAYCLALGSFRLPRLAGGSHLVRGDLHFECCACMDNSRPAFPEHPFNGTPHPLLLLFEFTVTKGNWDINRREATMVLMPSLLRDMIRAKGEMPNQLFEWNDWGPSSTRILENIEPSSVCQYRLLMQTQERSAIIDFNPVDIARDLRRGRDTNIISEKSTWRYGGGKCGSAEACNTHSLETRLPYRCVEVEDHYEDSGPRVRKVMGRRLYGLRGAEDCY